MSAFDDCEALFDKTSIPGLKIVDGWVIKSAWSNIIHDEQMRYYDISVSGEITFSGIRGIADRACDSCSQITKIVLPSTVKYIGEFAFCDCIGLEEIFCYPNGVVSIGKYAFMDCTSLTSICLPDRSLTYIGEAAFYRCTSLIRLDVPTSISSRDGIGRFVFLQCGNLRDLRLFGIDYATVLARAKDWWGVPSGCVVTCNDGTRYTVP